MRLRIKGTKLAIGHGSTIFLKMKNNLKDCYNDCVVQTNIVVLNTCIQYDDAFDGNIVV